MRTRVVIEIVHPDDLDNVDEETITETFDEAGDMEWSVTIVSIEKV